MPSKLLTTNEMADLYRCTAKTIRVQVREGVLPEPIRFGPRGHLRFDPIEVERFLATSLRGRPVDAAQSSGPGSASDARRDPAHTATEGEQ